MTSAQEAGPVVHEFQAEVSRLMDIIINSLYSNKDIFLRELISNASDALDKLRFLSLTDKELMGSDEELKAAVPEIRISADPEAGLLTISDHGIGMSEEEMVLNLGTVARSGTAKFIDAAKGGDADMSLIGQFGVGFYSAYLVADRVTVRSRRPGHKQYVWSSDAQSTFTVGEDEAPENSVGHHGTSITLHLKEDALETYTKQENLEDIVGRYSQFIDFPILLHKSKIVTREVVVESEPEAADVSEDDTVVDDSEELEMEDEDDVEETGPRTETIEETVWEWEVLNENKPLWTRSKDEVTDEEYKGFYRAALDKSATEDPLAYTHFKAEGGIDFTALLYVPAKASKELYDQYYTTSSEMKLYVRRVLLADKFEDFLPRYLNFIRGVVDTDDLPINVSRETLQKSKTLTTIGKRLVRAALKMLEQLAAKETVTDEETETEVDENTTTYTDFYNEFSRSLKLGVLEDSKNKDKLLKLLRYTTSKSEDKEVSLAAYVERMKEGQSSIYYISGESIESVQDSPMLERLHSRDLEVVYFVDPLDEYILQQVPEYDGHKLVSVSSDKLDLGDDEDDAETEAALTEEFKPFTDWMTELLSGKFRSVQVSSRITKSPAVIVSGQFGVSANMERLMRSNPNNNGNAEYLKFMTSQRIVEINPNHEIVKALKAGFESKADMELLTDSVALLVDTALLSSGFEIQAPLQMASRVHRALSGNLGLDVEYPEVAIEEEEPDMSMDDLEQELGHDEL